MQPSIKNSYLTRSTQFLHKVHTGTQQPHMCLCSTGLYWLLLMFFLFIVKQRCVYFWGPLNLIVSSPALSSLSSFPLSSRSILHLQLISSKVPKAEYVPTIIRRDDPSIIPILYVSPPLTLTDIDKLQLFHLLCIRSEIFFFNKWMMVLFICFILGPWTCNVWWHFGWVKPQLEELRREEIGTYLNDLLCLWNRSKR